MRCIKGRGNLILVKINQTAPPPKSSAIAHCETAHSGNSGDCHTVPFQKRWGSSPRPLPLHAPPGFGRPVLSLHCQGLALAAALPTTPTHVLSQKQKLFIFPSDGNSRFWVRCVLESPLWTTPRGRLGGASVWPSR